MGNRRRQRSACDVPGRGSTSAEAPVSGRRPGPRRWESSSTGFARRSGSRTSLPPRGRAGPKHPSPSAIFVTRSCSSWRTRSLRTRMRSGRSNRSAPTGAPSSNIQVGTRATVATELVKMLHLSTWPAAGVVAGHSRVRQGDNRGGARHRSGRFSPPCEDAIATVPASVTIPAGELFADFEIRGPPDGGPSTLTAETTEPGLRPPPSRDSTWRRVSTASSWIGCTSTTCEALPAPRCPGRVDYRVRDENRLPYSGIELSFSQGIPGAEPIPSAMTDSDGRVRVEWQLAPKLGTQVLKAYLEDAPEMAVLTRAKAAGAVPTLAPAGAVNAASGERASSGRGFAPGSLITVYGNRPLPRKRRTRTRFWRLGIAHFPSFSTASASTLGECRPRWSGCLRPKLHSSFRLNSKGPRSRWESRHCMREGDTHRDSAESAPAGACFRGVSPGPQRIPRT